MDSQQAAYVASPEIKRDEQYFREKIGSVKTAEQLVSDRRLLKVALGAYGLDADINNKFFIRKVLEDGTVDTGALANRLADKQYLAFSRAFGFGDNAIPNSQASDFAGKILSQYKTRSFETAVGNQDDTMRLALNAERELPALAARTTSSEDTLWFTVMGSAPLRQVFQTAFGLPSSFGSIDLDQQLSTYKARAERAFGDSGIKQFAEPEAMEALVRRFLAQSEAQASSTRGGTSAALTILQSGQSSLRSIIGR
jgi:hypothetical protein